MRKAYLIQSLEKAFYWPKLINKEQTIWYSAFIAYFLNAKKREMKGPYLYAEYMHRRRGEVLQLAHMAPLVRAFIVSKR